MTRSFDSTNQMSRYSPLGLIANPFLGVDVSPAAGEACEVASESNSLLQLIIRASTQDAPKPIWVTKDTFIPDSFSLAAESRVEETMAGDDSAAFIHAYIPLFGMRVGAARSALTLLSERLVYRQVDLTMAAYVERVLAEPDLDLPSYQVVGPEAMEAFGQAFSKDQPAAFASVFGDNEIERQIEIAQIADLRQLQYEGDEDVPADTIEEIDQTMGDAPGTRLVGMNAEIVDGYSSSEIANYIIEYASEHLSPVIGRAFRVYRDRGVSAMAAEFNITKAPRKTLAAVAKFARVRYRRAVIMWDGFDNWLDIEPGLRSKIVGMLSELRWTLADDAVMVFLVQEGQAPELEESFGSGDRLSWTFPGFDEMADAPDALNPEMIDRWLANASADECSTLTFASPVLAPIVDAASGSLSRFISIAVEAIEDAADSKASTIGADTVARAIAAVDAPSPEVKED